MSNQTSSPTASDIRTRMMNRGPAARPRSKRRTTRARPCCACCLYLKPLQVGLDHRGAGFVLLYTLLGCSAPT